MSGGGGGTKQTTNSNQTNTPFQQQQNRNLLAGADAWMQSGGFDKTYFGGQDSVADLTGDQQAGLAGQSQTGQNLQGLFNTSGNAALADYLGTYDPNKTGLNSAIDAANSRSNFNFETQVNPQIRQGATGAGQYGSSRHGIAEGLARGQLAQSQSDNAQTLAFQDQQNFNANRMNALNNLGNISQGLNSGNQLQYNSGQLQQTQNQNEIAGALQKWTYENNVSLDDLKAYQSLISGDMGGTITGQSTTKSSGGGASPWGTVGAIGGAVLGSFLGPMGTAAGAQLGSMAGNAVGGGGQSGGGGLSSTQASRM
ncbi:hypothetical protein D3C71_1301280 [compost metagenome]